MRKITDYALAQNAVGRTLAAHVSEMMEDGWQPFGGVSSHPDGMIYAQAMVKYDTAVEDDVVAQINDIHTEMVIGLSTFLSNYLENSSYPRSVEVINQPNSRR